MRRFPFLVLMLGWLVSAPASGRAEDVHVRAGQSQEAANLHNRANGLFDKGDYEGALRTFDAAIRVDPTMWPAYYGRARVLARQHRWQLVVENATMALRGGSWFTESAILRATANRNLGKYAASLADLNKVVSLQPRGRPFALALNARAWLRATCQDPTFRNGRQALEDAERACAATLHKDGAMLDTLAAAYAENGDFDSAVKYAESAIRAGPAAGEDGEAIRRHLALFKQRRPVREGPK